ncbi:histidine kinase dimerization/phosphoacceptor domain -containing protein [Algoriphagus sp.]|uniref:tetratricopeptide repeat-containing sensor histidine kinase n=1 Tax=Algoriphagus sp. TaxID=1872435 RepID=UPI003F7239FB
MFNSNRTIYLPSGILPVLLFFLSFGVQAHTKRFSDYLPDVELKPLQIQRDTNYVNQLLQLGNPMSNKGNQVQPDMSTALLYTEQAKHISDSLHYPKGQILSSFYLAYIFSQKGQKEQALGFLSEGIKVSKEKGYNRQGATGWYTLRDSYMVAGEQLTEVILWFEQALIVSQNLGNKQIEADILKEIAFLHHQQGKNELGANILQKVLTIYDSINNPKLHYAYDLLTAIHQNLGNYPEALKYSLATLKSAQNTSDTTHIANFYIRLGMVYRDLKQMNNSLDCFESALIHSQGAKQTLTAFNALSLVSSTLIMLGKKQEGLDVVLDYIKVNPPEDQASKILVTEILFNCYLALKKYQLANKYILEMVSYQDQRPQNDLYKMIVMQKASKLFLEMKAFEKSEFYLQKAIMLNQQLGSTQNKISQQLLFFQLDSAQGRFQEAISHYQLYKALQDSIFNEAKSKEIAKLEVQYASEKKERELLLRESNIKTLTREKLLQEEKIKKDQFILNVISGGTLMLILLLSVIYNRYRLKRHSNQLLEVKQQEIHNKNEILQQLLSEKNNLLAEKEYLLKHKDLLLVEKEWLLKEIHHRVKNNLQMVMSLLNSQVASLQDKVALSAIQDSQNRVQAMALIHQKLYQADGMNRIPIKAYIEEIVAYLRESYAVSQHVSFKLFVGSIELDINLAVPLGLIINEAITNAYKYAFPGERPGVVHLSLLQKSKTRYELTIEDDGVGFPKEFDPLQSRSLGMTLIHGFSEQLGADLTIESKQGVKITLIFSNQ